jgi:hypothetical protein
MLIRADSDRPLQLDAFNIGRHELEAELGSKVNFQVAKGWLHQCQKKHGAKCGGASPDPRLPTRVIDVGKPGDSPPSPKLLACGRARGQYLALSHCWGGHIETTLKTNCLDEFLTALPWARLARNFQDAIHITQNLGIRYLWIDALCIIQDSTDDWAVESGKMAALYEDALFTIAALSSPGSSHGILLPPQQPTGATGQTDVQIRVSGNKMASLRIHRSDEEETLAKLVVASPMTQRGWCLQESVLSRRILYFGQQQIYWECGGGYQAANGDPGRSAYPDQAAGVSALQEHLRSDAVQPSMSRPFSTVRQLFSKTHPRVEAPSAESRRQEILFAFYDICREYSRRGLTYGTDKLPAMSGVAKRLQAMIGGEYLAGIWSVGFREGLLWSALPGGSGVTRGGEYRAPSWSWASVDGEVVYYRAGFNPSFSPASRHADDVQLLDFDIQLKDGHVPYGQVTAGWALVQGLSIKLRLVGSGSGWKAKEKPVAFCYFDSAEMAARSGFHDVHVDGSGTQSGDPTLYISAPKLAVGQRDYLVLLVRRRPDSQDSNSDVVECVVLEEKSTGRDSGDREYRRVGMLGTYPSMDELITTWERQTLRLI